MKLPETVRCCWMEVKIKIRDLGFGEIVKSSDLTWEYTMSL